MTINIFGPDNPNSIEFHKGKVKMSEHPFSGDFITVSEALEAYCNFYGSKIRQYDGKEKDFPISQHDKKFFYYLFANGDETLVDIHVIKANGDDICLRQDLTYTIEDKDIIRIGMPAC